ncbi:hypothetical protein [Aliarcobacter butzleri]|uniref:DNA-binding protein n=1 Tax=Aliarcobacter butzleri TaxID=28197 RepID=A0AAW7PTK3_9BACT|nr:hypothetical protein [Aliarcobacter butzleri]MDN5064536.1 hypothetical protein [Aliarcobacter butzleri]MDN5065986.1 hypothetical protein [Aliarcobacter butzleri]
MDKFEFYLKKIETMFPEETTLNAGQYCKIKGICRTSFHKIIVENQLHKLPKFDFEEIERKNGTLYRNYSFNVFDVAKFLSK